MADDASGSLTERTEESLRASVVVKMNFSPSVLELVSPVAGPLILMTSAEVVRAPSPHSKVLPTAEVSLMMVVLRVIDARPVVVLSIVLVPVFLVWMLVIDEAVPDAYVMVARTRNLNSVLAADIGRAVTATLVVEEASHEVAVPDEIAVWAIIQQSRA